MTNAVSVDGIPENYKIAKAGHKTRRYKKCQDMMEQDQWEWAL